MPPSSSSELPSSSSLAPAASKWYKIGSRRRAVTDDGAVKALQYPQLFKYASRKEKAMVAAGVLSAAAHGALLPILAILWGACFWFLEAF